MELLDLLDELESLVVQSRRLPMGGNLVVDRKQLLDVVDRMRLALPEDLATAQKILDGRKSIEREAHLEAERIIQAARGERDRLVEDDEIVAQAQRRAAEITQTAERQAAQIMEKAEATSASHLSESSRAAREQLNDADNYALEMLERLEQQLEAYLDSVRQGLDGLQERRD